MLIALCSVLCVCSLPLCRNLEWMVCAARGQLPGQGGPTIIFSIAPNQLDPNPNGPKPFGQCRGWRPAGIGGCGTGYATDSIFYLEVCVFNQICSNAWELWSVRRGDPFRCELSDDGFRGLQALLLETPDWGAPQDGSASLCKDYCNPWTCASRDCQGCEGIRCQST